MIGIEKHIEGCKKNNPASQRAFYAHFSRQMYNICLRYCKNVSDAEDVLQMGFVKAFENINQLHEHQKAGGWLRIIMVRTALRFIKQKPEFVLLEDNYIHNLDFEMNIDFDTYTYDKLLVHLHKLPLGYQTVFNLYVFEEMSHAEIAKKINCSENTSRSQLYKARKQLQEWVQEDLQLQPLVANRI